MKTGYEERLESNKTVEEAVRMKGYLLFSFDKHDHKIDITKKECENSVITVRHIVVGSVSEYKFTLNDVYANAGDYAKLVTEFALWEDGITSVKNEIEFTFEKFVGEELEEKVVETHTEVEEYTTRESLQAIYRRALA